MLKMIYTKNQNDMFPARRNIALLVIMVVAGVAFAMGINRPSYASIQGLDKLNQFLQTSNSSDPAIKQLREGRDAIEEEDWDRAVERFNDFISDHPRHKDVDQALYWLAFSLTKLDRYQEADEKLNKLISEYPKSTWKKDAEAKKIELASKLGTPQTVNKGIDAGDEEIKTIALQSVCQSGSDRCVDLIAEIIRDSKGSMRFRENAIALLGQHGGGKRTTELLKEIVRNQQDVKLRKTAIFWLGQNGDASVVDILKDLVNSSKDNETAEAALFALSQNGSSQASQLISDLAMQAPTREIRLKAIFWLSQRGGESVQDQLMSIYNSSQDTEIKKQVLFALSQRSSSSARAKLLEIAQRDKDIEIRKQAIFWIGQSGGEDAARALASIYDSEPNDE